MPSNVAFDVLRTDDTGDKARMVLFSEEIITGGVMAVGNGLDSVVLLNIEWC